MAQILINNLTKEDINSALLRIQRAIKNNQASVNDVKNSSCIVVNGGSATVGSKYDDSALIAQINALSATIEQALNDVNRIKNEVYLFKEDIEANTANITTLQYLVTNINFSYDENTNTITFTNCDGTSTEIPLVDTTYDFSFDDTTHKLTIHNNLTDEDVFDGVVDTVYSFSWNSGTLTITNNRSNQSVATINFDNRYYTKDDIAALVLDLIPAQASSSNQLADKNFVNSSIETSTATFRGTFNSLADLEAYSGPKDNNDYAFVKTLDSQSGLYQYDRYKYNGTVWVYEYTINNSGFTAAQLAAINSGITDTLVAKITDVYNPTICLYSNGSCCGSFTLNQSSNKCIGICNDKVKFTNLETSSNRPLLFASASITNEACCGVYYSNKILANACTGVLTAICFNGPASNTTCFNGCTYSQVCNDIRSGLVTSTELNNCNYISGFDIYCGNTCKCTVNKTNNTLFLGSLAFSSDTIPLVHDSIITLNQNGTCAGSFTLNQDSDKTISLTDCRVVHHCLGSTSADCYRNLLIMGAGFTDGCECGVYYSGVCPIRFNHKNGLLATMNTDNWGSVYSSTTNTGYYLLAQYYGSTAGADSNHDVEMSGTVYMNNATYDRGSRFHISVRGRGASVSGNKVFKTDKTWVTLCATYEVEASTNKFIIRLYGSVPNAYTRFNTVVDYVAGGDVSTRVSTCNVTFPGTYFTSLPSTETVISRTSLYEKGDVGLGNVDNTSDANKSVKNATCFDSCTYEQACNDIRSGLQSQTLISPVNINGASETTVQDALNTLDGTYTKKTVNKDFSASHCRYIYLGKFPLSSGTVSSASLTLYLFSSNSVGNYPLGNVQMNVSSGAGANCFNINGYSSIPLNNSSSSCPRIIVTKDTTSGYHCLWLDDSYTYLKARLQLNCGYCFTLGDLGANASLSGTSIWTSETCNDIFYVNGSCVYLTKCACVTGPIKGCNCSLLNCTIKKVNNTVAGTTGAPTYRLLYDVTSWWNAAGTSSSNTSARGLIGNFVGYRCSGYGLYTNVDVEAYTNYGRGSVTNPLTCCNVLKLSYNFRGGNNIIPVILHDSTCDKYYLSLLMCGFGDVPYTFNGMSFGGDWLTCNICATDTNGTLPSGWELCIKGIKCNSDSFELYGGTPYIDFHAGNSLCDYTHRISVCGGSNATNTGWLQFVVNGVNCEGTCTPGNTFYMYPNGTFKAAKALIAGSDASNSCSRITLDCSAQNNIVINASCSCNKGLLLTTANDVTTYCSLGMRIESENVNRGLFDCDGGTFRWLLYTDDSKWNSNLDIALASGKCFIGPLKGVSDCADLVKRNTFSSQSETWYLPLWSSQTGDYTCLGCTSKLKFCLDASNCGVLTTDLIYSPKGLHTNAVCSIYPSTSQNCCVVIVARCCNDSSLTTKCMVFDGTGTLCVESLKPYCTCGSISFPACSTTYVLLGCFQGKQLDNEYQIGFFASGSSLVNNGVLKWVGSNANTNSLNNIELKVTNYCNSSYGITGIGFKKTGSCWNCYTCVILRVCNPSSTSCTWDIGVYKNQVGLGWCQNRSCLGSTAPTFDCLIAIPTGCRNYYHNNANCACFTGILRANRFISDSYPLKYSQTLNLSTQCAELFYPIVYAASSSYEADIEIQSPGGSSSCPYNQNYIHYFQRANGWNDTKPSLYIQTLTRYDTNENVFGCIGYGTKSSNYSVIWLRGGRCYAANANVCLNVKTSDWTSGGTDYSIYTVGTNLCGGTNTNVEVFANATDCNGSFIMCNTYGCFYNRSKCPYILKCEVDACGFVDHDSYVQQDNSDSGCFPLLLSYASNPTSGCSCYSLFTRCICVNTNDGSLCSCGCIYDKCGRLTSCVGNIVYEEIQDDDDADFPVMLLLCCNNECAYSGPSCYCCHLTFQARCGCLTSKYFNGCLCNFKKIYCHTFTFSSANMLLELSSTCHTMGISNYVLDLRYATAYSCHTYIYLTLFGDFQCSCESGYSAKISGTCSGITVFGTYMNQHIMAFGLTGMATCNMCIDLYAVDCFAGCFSTGICCIASAGFNVYSGTEPISFISPVHESTTAFRDVSAEVLYAKCIVTTSKSSTKKNIRLYGDCALNLLRDTNIYEYNYKTDQDDEVKHIGIIADYTNELLSGKNKDSFRHSDAIGLLLKAVKELDENQHPFRKMFRRIKKWLNHLLKK